MVTGSNAAPVAEPEASGAASSEEPPPQAASVIAAMQAAAAARDRRWASGTRGVGGRRDMRGYSLDRDTAGVVGRNQ